MQILYFILITIFLHMPTFAASLYKDKEHSIELITGYNSSYGLNTVTMGLHFKFQGEWKTYWREPGLVGYPLKIKFDGSQNVKNVSNSWPAPEQFTTFQLKSYGYHNEVVLPLYVTLEDPTKPTVVNLQLDYLVCDPSNCLKRDVTLNLPLNAEQTKNNISPKFDLIKSFIDKIPTPDNGAGMTIDRAMVDTSTVNHYVLTVHARNSKAFKNPVLFIEPHTDMYVDIPEIEFSADKTQVVFTAKVYSNELKKRPPMTSLINRNFTFTLKDGDTAIESQRLIKEEESGLLNYLLILVLALIGGFILNFMPCVLPVILIKIFAIFQHGGEKAHVIRTNFFLTAFGILSSFLAVALLSIIFRQFGYAVGWGVQFQNPYFLISIMLIIALFAYNLLGWFEILLSSKIATELTKAESTDSRISYFLSGAFVTILATPCTAPFMGTALTYALSRDALEIITIFLMMGVGLALPFILIGLFPKFARKLPKPGRWMMAFKKSLSILLFATVGWLLWTFSAVSGNNAAAVLAGLLVVLGLVLFAKSRKVVSSRFNWIAALVLMAIAFSLPITAGQEVADRNYKGTVFEKFDEAKITEYVKQGKTVFVDVTADWCLTCKANELFILKTKEMEETFAHGNPIIMIADWTNGDEAITVFLQRFGKFGVPFYVIFGPKHPDGLVLPEVLTHQIVKDNLKAATK